MDKKDKYVVTSGDRLILRKLAAKVAELAALPIQEGKRRLWYRHNSLEATRPLIFCDPENGWHEIITNEHIQCESEIARGFEWVLRREIFWGELDGHDGVIEPFFTVGYIYRETDWGMHETRIYGENGGSFKWDAPLKDYKDFDKLCFPEISIDYEETDRQLNLAVEILGDILTVRLKGSWWWTLGLTETLVLLRGLEQVMYDMYDYPDELHRLMVFLRDGHLAKLDFLEKNGLLSLNNGGNVVGSGGLGYTNELPQKGFIGNHVRTMDMWGFAESQETTQISPQMFQEFVFPYQLPILERFGLNHYGCCEALEQRWHTVRKIPGLRRVSVSPWANIEAMSDNLGDGYIYSMKPNPAVLATPQIDEEFIRRNIREALKKTRGCRVEVIMKDNHTIGHNPQNVVRWCKIAREEADSV